VLVQGGAGSVGACAVQLAHQAGARVIATCRAESDRKSHREQERMRFCLPLFFVGSDDVPTEAKIEATRDINRALEAGWKGLDIAEIVPLDQIARAHELVEHPVKPRARDCGDHLAPSLARGELGRQFDSDATTISLHASSDHQRAIGAGVGVQHGHHEDS